MLVALFIVPGALLASLAATVILVVILSVSVATIAGPAVLTLLGHNVNRWRIGRPQSYQDESSGLMVDRRRRPADGRCSSHRRSAPSSSPSRRRRSG